jgi:methyl-accepting chemotaxis protein
MKLRTELLVYTALLAGLNLLLAFGAIGLFVRMGPAIERILRENVASIDAAEEILIEFAAASGGMTPEGRKRVEAALGTIRTNVTEAGESPVIARIEQRFDGAAQGDAEARAAVIEDVRRLIAINREAMTAVDEEARRLGAGGAWAAVFVGALSFGLSLVVIVLLRRRLLEPLLELHAVLSAARGGDRFRRCRAFDAAIEVKQAAQSVNALLDERIRP